MSSGIHRCFDPLGDCCCQNTPRILLRSVASMAFNFSAVPERAPETGRRDRTTPRGPMQIFSRLDFLSATS